ncbi:MAG: AAA family ATPase [Candidatus Omnitrophica bacterium]|nr:AAA family ATPase [Candidatus Omnitrophota bacterium]
MRSHKKIKIFFIEHWVKILVIVGALAVTALAIWGLSTMESFYRNMTLASIPLQLLMVALNAMIFVYMYMTVFRGGFSKLDKGLIKGDKVAVGFKDVVGMEESKQEAWEVVELIRDHRRLKQIGGKIVRGILMLGPPGCGKTYLAKAIANEAKIPFISMSASSFVEVFVGVGASRVRKVFKQARRLAEANGGCIVFIDEVDSIATRRGFSYLGGGMEKDSTQNQLLAEMDGLKEKDYNVIVIAATNAPETELDEALKRPGRFDRKIYIDKPSLEDREKLFKYYMAKVKYDPLIDIGRLARQAVYKTPADIMNIVKESALIATRNKRDMVTLKDLTEAIDRIDLGIKHRKFMTPGEKEMVAYHESGHLVVLYLIHPTDDVFKATIISHKGALGLVQHQPKEELHTRSKEALLTDIRVSLGGYVAEKMKYNTTSSGVSQDFKTAMAVAHTMVWSLGMGESNLVGDYGIYGSEGGPAAASFLAESTKEQLNKETQHILQNCLKDTEVLLKKEWNIVERFVKELLGKEELEYDEIDAIFKEYGKEHKK